MMSRLGVLGGMFDPVHNGHIEAARFARDSLQLDRVKLIPCLRPNHRDPASAGAEHRLAMVALAVAGHRGLEGDDMEIRRGGVSYSVDTLKALKDSAIARRLVFIVGMDAFNTLPAWHRWQELLQLCHLLVLARPGSAVSDRVAEQADLAARQVENADDLFGDSGGKILVVEDFHHDISSTTIRERLRRGADLSEKVNREVLAYIKDHGLYQQSPRTQ